MSTLSRGFTLVELMVTISVLAILLAVGAPSFNEFVANTKVRNVAENFYSGIQTARAEAIRSNEPVNFFLTDDVPDGTNSGSLTLTNEGKNWAVHVPGRPVTSQLIASKIAAEGGATAINVKAVDAGDAAVTTLTFNGLGSLSAPSTAVKVEFAHPMNLTCDTTSAKRCVYVLVSLGGQSRFCESGRPAGDRRGCG